MASDPLAVEAAALREAVALALEPFVPVGSAVGVQHYARDMADAAIAAYEVARPNSLPGKLGEDPVEPTCVGGEEARQEDGADEVRRLRRMLNNAWLVINDPANSFLATEPFSREIEQELGPIEGCMRAARRSPKPARPVTPEREGCEFGCEDGVIREAVEGTNVPLESTCPVCVIPEQEAGYSDRIRAACHDAAGQIRMRDPDGKLPEGTRIAIAVEVGYLAARRPVSSSPDEGTLDRLIAAGLVDDTGWVESDREAALEILGAPDEGEQ